MTRMIGRSGGALWSAVRLETAVGFGVVMLIACCGVRTTLSPSSAPAAASTAVAPAAAASARANSGTAPASSVAARAVEPEENKPSAPPVAVVMPDIDYWATPQPVVDKMLELAKVQAADVVYDLGCGDARSLITAAERYGAKGVGFDIDPHLVAAARENVRRHGVEHLVRIEQANIFGLDLSGASVIFLYITPRFNLRLVAQFEKMRRGSRIVSHEFEIPGAKPARVIKVAGPPDGPPDAEKPAKNALHTIYLWRLPWTKVYTDWKMK